MGVLPLDSFRCLIARVPASQSARRSRGVRMEGLFRGRKQGSSEEY